MAVIILLKGNAAVAATPHPAHYIRHLLLKEKAFGWRPFSVYATCCIPPHPLRYAQHLLPSGRRLLWSARGRSCQHQPSLVFTLNKRLPWHADRRSAQGVRSTTEGGKQEANGGKLAFIRAVQAFTGHGAAVQPSSFYSSSFPVHNTGSLFLS